MTIDAQTETGQRPTIHILHIGKTGGSAIRHALRRKCMDSRYKVILHPHRIGLRDIPEGERFVFFLRDPVSRFVSGFYSRQRQGRPRYDIPWKPGEKTAFETFHTPNQLATALSSWNPWKRRKARAAMRSIQHVKNSYRKWLDSEEYFRSRIADIFFIGFQEQFSDDFALLKSKLECPPDTSLPKDDTRAHRNPDNLDTRLDAKAIRNLEEWYKADFRLVALCREIRDTLDKA